MDCRLFIPRSISAACAQEIRPGEGWSASAAQRQRQNAGMYQRANSMLPPQEQQRLLFEGGYPVLARVARQKGLPYPHVNEQGEVEVQPRMKLCLMLKRKLMMQLLQHLKLKVVRLKS